MASNKTLKRLTKRCVTLTYIHEIFDCVDFLLEVCSRRVGVGEVGGDAGDDVAEEEDAGDHDEDTQRHLALHRRCDVTVAAKQAQRADKLYAYYWYICLQYIRMSR